MNSESRIIIDRAIKIICDSILEYVASEGIGVLFQGRHGNGKMYSGNSSIYGGAAGTLWVLLRVFKLTHCSRLKSILKEGVATLLERTVSEPPSTFLTGSLGVSYILGTVANELNNNALYNKTRKYLLETCNLNYDTSLSCDYLTGSAGNIIGLIVCQNFFNINLREKIEFNCNFILDNMKPCGNGVAWFNNLESFSPLCGLAHGAAGIGLALIHASQYIKNNFIKEAGKAAFEYESWCFRKYNIFPDFRIFPSDRQKILSDFNLCSHADLNMVQPRRMDMWCHGSLGILLSRVSAAQILDRCDVDPQILVALRQCKGELKRISLNDQSISICHGLSGYLIADTICRYRHNISIIKNRISMLIKIIDLFSDSREKIEHNLRFKHDISLFNGYCGLLLVLELESSLEFNDLFPIII